MTQGQEKEKIIIEENNRVLLHSCCAICSGYPIQYLRDAQLESVVYFYNPNLYPYGEYEKRLGAQKILCEKYEVELIEGVYDNEKYEHCIQGLENEPERGKRCEKCFEMRLLNTAYKAKDLGIKYFTTSIAISPHKNFSCIKEIGNKVANIVGIEFLAIDFKKKDGFLKTNHIAKELDLYRQNYCGCRYSIRN